MIKNYFALTIGPIYGTFAQAKKTRAVWAASYFFSWFIKETLARTRDDGFEILLPYHEKILTGKHGAGMYADRLYFIENGKGNAAGLRNCLDGILSELSEDICRQTNVTDRSAVLSFLKAYLNLHIVDYSRDDAQQADNKDATLKTLNDLLDNSELRTSFSFEYDENPLLNYLELETSAHTLLIKDAFKHSPGRHFRSVPEIASTSLQRQHEGDYAKYVEASFKTIKGKSNQEFELLDELKKSETFSPLFRPYHKYFAVLYADGDNISDLLKKVSGNQTDLTRFSELLMKFAGQAEQAIYEYGGNGIYHGGEDVLAFIPLACKHHKTNELQTVFSLINDLDQLFMDILGRFAIEKGVKPPTLSFGVMVSYVKHPLKESMHIAHGLLEDAKNKLKHPFKNTIGLRFQKHSGQVMKCFIEKTIAGEKSWKEIRDFTKKYTKDALQEKQQNILSGIIHRFKDDIFFATFIEAARTEERLTAFFANFFNEDIHKQANKDTFLKDIRALSIAIVADYNADKNATRDILFTVLRLVHFINSEKE